MGVPGANLYLGINIHKALNHKHMCSTHAIIHTNTGMSKTNVSTHQASSVDILMLTDWKQIQRDRVRVYNKNRGKNICLDVFWGPQTSKLLFEKKHLSNSFITFALM